jgi:hypothetical protein
MIFTSYHPVYTLDAPPVEQATGGYHRFHIGKTKEFAVLWYLYARQFLGKDEHITILDQGGEFRVSDLLEHIDEPYDIAFAYPEVGRFYDPTSPTRLHIRQFMGKEGVREGVKRLYNYMYKACYKNSLDMFFIEGDCLIAKDWLSICRANQIDFATNTFSLQNHRACDTYINYISAARFHDRDAFAPLDQWLDWVKATYGDYKGENDWDALYDVSSTILNERGAYLQFCYGNVVAFNGDGVMHSVSRGDEDRLDFIRANPIDHPFYRSFLERATEITASHAPSI